MAKDVVVKVEGLKELQDALKKFPKEWGRTAQQSLGSGMALVETEAKKKAPVDTSRLQSSIGSQIVRGPGSVIIGKVGSSVDYASYQEYGTSRMPAHPYLRPALRENLSKVVKLFEKGIAQALKRLKLR